METIVHGFKKWLLQESDIFGFEKNISKITKFKDNEDDPIISIDTERVIGAMIKTEINNHEPFSDFLDEIQWGRDVGAVKMVVSPLGSFKSIIRKMSTDLEGNKVWICKKILVYNDFLHATKEFDESLATEIVSHIETIVKENIEMPKREYNGLERLTRKLATSCRRKDVIPEIFIFKGIKQIVKNQNYLIYFECAGHGVETPGSGRLEQFIIDMSYNPKTGLIRSFGHDVQSRVRQHVWIPQPSEWDEYFSSTQLEREIINCISSALSTY